jgi:hypothetical protein
MTIEPLLKINSTSDIPDPAYARAVVVAAVATRPA